MTDWLKNLSPHGLAEYRKLLKLLQIQSDSRRGKTFPAPSPDMLKEAKINPEVAANIIYTLAKEGIIRGSTLALGYEDTPPDDIEDDQRIVIEVKGQPLNDMLFSTMSSDAIRHVIFHSSTRLEIKTKRMNKLQQRIDARLGNTKDTRVYQLEWNAKDKIIAWGSLYKKLNNQPAIALFLEVMSQTIGQSKIPTQELAEYYDQVCSRKRTFLEDKGMTVPKYLKEKYTEKSTYDFEKQISYALDQLKTLLDVRGEDFFPIERHGAGKNAKWEWREINPHLDEKEL
ncbi:MAG: hypothetical protein WD000_01605 [Thermodesulfobacteriota bacterium]